MLLYTCKEEILPKEREVNKMNVEAIKAMNKKETKSDAIRKWWNKNGYKVMRVIFFPI